MKKLLLVLFYIGCFFFLSTKLYSQSNQTVTNGSSTTAVNFNSGCTYNWVNSDPTIGLAASGSGNIASFTGVNTGKSPVIATITATPVNTNYSYAYIASASDGTVDIINTYNNTIAGTIQLPSDAGPWGVAASPDGSRIYVANSNNNTIAIINTATNKVINTITGITFPYGIVVSPDGNFLYITNFTPSTVSVISTVTNKLVATITVGKDPTGICISPDGKKVYVANRDAGSISIINTATNLVTSTIKLANNDAENVCLSPDGSLLYVSSFTLVVINTANNSTIADIPLGYAPIGISVSADGNTIYVANANSNTVSVINAAKNIVTATIPVGSQPQGTSLSADGSYLYVENYRSSNVSVISTATNLVTTTIPTAPYPNSLGIFTVGVSCNSSPVTFTITVNPSPPPTVTADGSLTPMTTIYGSPSSIERFTISGTGIISGILITPPAGFEVSLNERDFSPTVTVNGTGNIPAMGVFIRLAATTHVGSYSGNVTISTNNVTDATLMVPVSTVTRASLTITADNKTRPFGVVNPPLTVTYSGFVNNDGPDQLTALPTLTTDATISSVVGQYAINVNHNAASPDYMFNYNPGILTITPVLSPLSIPNAFTPNGDGINDTWEIQALEFYPKSTVTIFNRWGQKLFTSIGYPIPWDGTYQGKILPSGTYYYIIDPKNGQAALSGWVAIIK